MRPPICAVCGRDFRAQAQSGELIEFSDYRALPDGMTGHPGGTEWFCPIHAPMASGLTHMTSAEAISKVRGLARVRTVALLTVPSLLTGASAVGISMAGSAVAGTTGLFVGALVGGMLGVLLSYLVSHRLKLLNRDVMTAAVTGGTIGFLCAAVVAVAGSTSFSSPVVPILSTLLVGAGFLAGRRYYRSRVMVRPVN